MSEKKKTAPAKATKKTVAKKAPKKGVKQTAKKAVKKTPKKTTVAPQSTLISNSESSGPELDKKAKEMMLSVRKRTETPALFKVRKSKNTPILFTMENVADILEKRKLAKEETEKESVTETSTKKSLKKEIEEESTRNRNHSAASLADILGFDPTEKKSEQANKNIPKKWAQYYEALLELRNHVSKGLALHAADTLKRSNKEDSGDPSNYGQHMADAETDAFDRDFALSLMSNEQEALYEIEEAIHRIFENNYGLCEITGKPIAKERLMAVPFTRYSLEGQRELERNQRPKQSRGTFLVNPDESISLGEEDGDD